MKRRMKRRRRRAKKEIGNGSEEFEKNNMSGRGDSSSGEGYDSELTSSRGEDDQIMGSEYAEKGVIFDLSANKIKPPQAVPKTVNWDRMA